MSRSAGRTVTTVMLMAGLAACVTPTPEMIARLYEPLASVDEPLATLRADAEAGQSRAQYSLSLVLRYGLYGQVIDTATAGRWRRLAVAPRGSMPITTYLAGINGRPGRVLSILVPQYDLSPIEGVRLDRCAAALNVAGATAQVRPTVCGDVDTLNRLNATWRKAVGHIDPPPPT